MTTEKEMLEMLNARHTEALALKAHYIDADRSAMWGKVAKHIKSALAEIEGGKPAKASQKVSRSVVQCGTRVVPVTTKAVKGVFGGKPVTLSDDTWKYLTRPLASATNVGDMARKLAAYYAENGVNPSSASVAGCGDRTLMHMAREE